MSKYQFRKVEGVLTCKFCKDQTEMVAVLKGKSGKCIPVCEKAGCRMQIVVEEKTIPEQPDDFSGPLASW